MRKYITKTIASVVVACVLALNPFSADASSGITQAQYDHARIGESLSHFRADVTMQPMVYTSPGHRGRYFDYPMVDGRTAVFHFVSRHLVQKTFLVETS